MTDPTTKSPFQPLLTVVKAGAVYFLLVFGVGFLLGPIRELWLVPRLGERYAELLEIPLMLVVIGVSARWLVQRFDLTQRWATVGAGLWALVLLVGAELLVVLSLPGLTVGDYIQNRDPVSGTAYLLSLLVFAAMPSWWARSRQVPTAPNDT